MGSNRGSIGLVIAGDSLICGLGRGMRARTFFVGSSEFWVFINSHLLMKASWFLRPGATGATR
jgi:hypothetical protein